MDPHLAIQLYLYQGNHISEGLLLYIITCHLVAMVMNIVVVISADSVGVSWDSLDIPEITGYIVCYSQTGTTQSVNVNTSTNSVVIGGLMNNVEYQFQVAAIAELDGEVIIGERSAFSIANVSSSCPQSIILTKIS